MTIVVGTVLASLIAVGAEAQIINTLRGFDNEARGWSGGIAGGVAFADGNTEYFEFELDGRVQFQTDRHRLRAIGINMRRTALGVEVAEARLGHLRHNYRLWSRISTVAFVQGQYNPFLRIQSRVLVGGGFRLDFFRGNMWNAGLGVTAMRETEELTYPVTARSETPTPGPTTRYRYNLFLTLYRVEKEGFEVDIWGFYQPLVDDFTDARASAAASFSVDLVGGLYFFSSYVVKHDDSPPPGVRERDTMLRSGLGWKF
jgi:hypothetical protein